MRWLVLDLLLVLAALVVLAVLAVSLWSSLRATLAELERASHRLAELNEAISQAGAVENSRQSS